MQPPPPQYYGAPPPPQYQYYAQPPPPQPQYVYVQSPPPPPPQPVAAPPPPPAPAPAPAPAPPPAPAPAPVPPPPQPSLAQPQVQAAAAATAPPPTSQKQRRRRPPFPNTEGETFSCSNQCLRFMLVMVVLAALLFSCFAAGSCNFMSISKRVLPELPSNGNNSTLNETTIVPRPTMAPTPAAPVSSNSTNNNSTEQPPDNNSSNSTNNNSTEQPPDDNSNSTQSAGNSTAETQPAGTATFVESAERVNGDPIEDGWNPWSGAGDAAEGDGGGDLRQRQRRRAQSSSNNEDWIESSLNDPYLQYLVEKYLANQSTTFEATIGLSRWNPQNTGCRGFDDPGNFDNYIETARAGAVIGVSFGAVALGLLMIEFLCCRYRCSRLILSVVLVLAFLGQTLTFVIYGTPYCSDATEELFSRRYSCGYGEGTTLSIIALILYLCAALLVCPTPKAQPILLVLAERERRQREEKDYDPCCWCFKPKDDNEQEVVAAATASAQAQATAATSMDPALQQTMMMQQQQQQQEQMMMQQQQQQMMMQQQQSQLQQNPTPPSTQTHPSFPQEVVVEQDDTSVPSKMDGPNSVDMEPPPTHPPAPASKPPRSKQAAATGPPQASASASAAAQTDQHTVYSTAEVYGSDLYFDTEE